MNMDGLSGLIDYGIVGLLIFMSVLALGVSVERFVFYRRVALDDYADLKSLELDLSRHLTIVATVAANAPYVLNGGAGEDDDADRHDGQHLVVALEGGGLGVLDPLGFEGDLRNLAGVGPAGGDLLGTFGRGLMLR